MLNVGLTGNIAAGKSTVVKLFARWGATVIDADALVREVQTPGSPVVEAIARRFGSEIVLLDGTLDRPALRRLITRNDDARADLNAIVHPAVGTRRAQYLGEAEGRGDLIVINDIPLLFEVLDPNAFDAIVLVDAPKEVRRGRLTRERGLHPAEADQLIDAQQPTGPKRDKSGFVIDNVGTVDDVEAEAWEVWRAIRRMAAAKSMPAETRLLAFFAHPDDETYAVGGTLARHGDAGVDTRLWCATRGESGKFRGNIVPPEEMSAIRTQELYEATRILSVKELLLHDFPDGALDPTDDAGIEAVANALRTVQPDVVVTFGPDGVTGHPDHLAVHAWVRAAWKQMDPPARLYYLTYPEQLAGALPRRLAGRPEGEIIARLDVRPWRDVKLAAIDAHASQTFPIPLDRPPGDALLEREWFAGPTSSLDCQDDLFERPGNA